MNRKGEGLCLVRPHVGGLNVKSESSPKAGSGERRKRRKKSHAFLIRDLGLYNNARGGKVGW